MTETQTQTTKRKARAKKGEGKPSEPTDYLILEAIKAEAIPADGEVKDLGQVEAWRVIGQAKTRAKKAAIDEVAGERGGIFKAVAASAWKGGERRFEQTKLVAEAIE